MDVAMFGWSLLVAVCVFGGHASARVCSGMGPNEYMNRDNIGKFRDCTVIDGVLRITEESFKGNDYQRDNIITPADLYVLQSVEEIVDYVVIGGKHEDFTSLEFLKNLRVIYGAELSEIGTSLQIFATNIHSLELTNLKRIDEGIVMIGHNPNLCFVDGMNWTRLFRNPNAQTLSIKFNRASGLCEAEGKVCDEECADGCWGLGPYNCLACANNVYEGTCVSSCNYEQGLYLATGTTECRRCHELCDRCFGPGADQCTECKTFRDGNRCVPRCGMNQYVDYKNECQHCHRMCKDGCTAEGPDDCFECRAYMDGTVCVDECPVDKYLDSYGMCQFCHSECLGGCTGPNNRECTGCKSLSDDGACVAECPSEKYADTEQGECRPCDSQCARGCDGPTNSDCFECSTLLDGSTCVDICPVEKYGDDNDECQPCNEECFGGCMGPGPNQCVACSYASDKGNCVGRCPLGKYLDSQRLCQFCDAQCSNGCSGPEPTMCVSCRYAENDGECVEVCPALKYTDEDRLCQHCHPQCDGGCSGPEADNCFGCRSVKIGSACAPECPDYTYADANYVCQSCDAECLYGCYGEGPLRCTSCRNFREGSRCVYRCPQGTCPDENNVCGPCRDLPAMPTYEELVLQVNQLKDQAQQLVTYNNLPLISFTAFSQPERADYYMGDSLSFDGIITNIGGGYDPETSRFTCPRSGVYLFSLSIDNYMRGSLVPTLYKDLEMIASAGQYNSASQIVIVECDAGEVVHVKTTQAGTMFNMYGWRTSTFSGYLLAHKIGTS